MDKSDSLAESYRGGFNYYRDRSRCLERLLAALVSQQPDMKARISKIAFDADLRLVPMGIDPTTGDGLYTATESETGSTRGR